MTIISEDGAISVGHFYNAVSNRNLYVQERDGVFSPSDTTLTLARGMQKIVGRHGDEKINILQIGVGSGVHILGLVALHPRIRIIGTDISTKALDATAKAMENDLSQAERDRVLLFEANLLEGISDKSLNNADYVVANLPQAVLPADVQMSASAAAARYYPANGMARFDPKGLGLNAELLSQCSGKLSPRAKIILTLGELFGPQSLRHMFKEFNYTSTTVHTLKARHDHSVDILPFVQTEAQIGEQLTSAPEPYHGKNQGYRKKQISIGEAHQLQRAGLPFYHSVSVIQGARA